MFFATAAPAHVPPQSARRACRESGSHPAANAAIAPITCGISDPARSDRPITPALPEQMFPDRPAHYWTGRGKTARFPEWPQHPTLPASPWTRGTVATGYPEHRRPATGDIAARRARHAPAPPGFPDWPKRNVSPVRQGKSRFHRKIAVPRPGQPWKVRRWPGERGSGKNATGWNRKAKRQIRRPWRGPGPTPGRFRL